MWRMACLALLGALAGTRASASGEYEYLMGVAEERFESVVAATGQISGSDDGLRARERYATGVARKLWSTVGRGGETTPEDIEVAFAPGLATPLAIFGRGKILADQAYAAALDDAALAAAIAHELAHLALEHQKRRLALGMALIGGDRPARTDRRVHLAMRLSQSDVESRLIEQEADERALRMLWDAGLDPHGLARALAALKPFLGEGAWDIFMEYRVKRARLLARETGARRAGY